MSERNCDRVIKKKQPFSSELNLTNTEAIHQRTEWRPTDVIHYEDQRLTERFTIFLTFPNTRLKAYVQAFIL